jgi:hypothetical protein
MLSYQSPPPHPGEKCFYYLKNNKCTYFKLVKYDFQTHVKVPHTSPLLTASARSGQDRSLFSRSIDGSPISLPDEESLKSSRGGEEEMTAGRLDISLASYESFISMFMLHTHSWV